MEFINTSLDVFIGTRCFAVSQRFKLSLRIQLCMKAEASLSPAGISEAGCLSTVQQGCLSLLEIRPQGTSREQSYFEEKAMLNTLLLFTLAKN